MPMGNDAVCGPEGRAVCAAVLQEQATIFTANASMRLEIA